jgi:hypothetical protein
MPSRHVTRDPFLYLSTSRHSGTKGYQLYRNRRREMSNETKLNKKGKKKKM